MKSILAWHFSGEALWDGTPLPLKGTWLKHPGECIMGRSGLHASRRPLDAFYDSPVNGTFLHRVECRGVEDVRDGLLVCRERRIVASVDAADLLRRFARKLALDVVHLLSPPEVIMHFLKTGDESARIATLGIVSIYAPPRWIAQGPVDYAVAAVYDAADAVPHPWRGAMTALWAAMLAEHGNGPYDDAWTKRDRWFTREAKRLMGCK